MLVGNAHLIAGNAEDIPALLKVLEVEGIKSQGNPDVYVRAYAQFGVDEAREIAERAAARALSSARRVFIIAASGMTKEAQNALLKTLEEPRAGALFFIITPSPETLLPTLRSRCQRLASQSSRWQAEALVDAKEFLAGVPEKRLEMLKSLLEKEDDDPSSGLGAGKRDLGAILSFLASLERELSNDPAKGAEGLRAARREGFESVYRARKYATDKGALLKPLLEQVALLTPRI